jgi:hypothetical protein
MPEPASRASGARAINEMGPPVSGRVEEAEAVALAVAEDVALAEALADALGEPEAIEVGEALDVLPGAHSPLSITSSNLAQSGVSSPTTSPVSESTLSPGSS